MTAPINGMLVIPLAAPADQRAPALCGGTGGFHAPSRSKAVDATWCSTVFQMYGNHRVTAEENEFKVVYRPNRDWVGEDFFTYSVFQGTAESTEATLSVHTRKCRLNRCENDLFDDIALRKIV